MLRDHLPTIRRCLFIGAAFSAAFNVWFLFLPSYLAASGAASLGLALGAALVGSAWRWLSRRPCSAGSPIATAAGRCWSAPPPRSPSAIVPLYLWAMGGSTVALLTGNVLIGLVIAAFVLPAFFAEQFPVRVRATGIGLSYGISSAVIGGTAPLLATVLSRQAAGAGGRVPGVVGRRGAGCGAPFAGDRSGLVSAGAADGQPG